MICKVGRPYDEKHPTCISCQAQGNGCQVVTESKPSKYHNEKVEVDGDVFDSKREYGRWQQLKMEERARIIANLKRQVSFELAPAVVVKGRKRPPLKYLADFTYTRNGQMIIEDAKGVITEAFRIKRHLMKSVLGLDILET